MALRKLRGWSPASLVILAAIAACGVVTRSRPVRADVNFAMIGDYGSDYTPTGTNGAPVAGTHAGEISVAQMVNSWNPSFVVTTGDNNYGNDGSDTNYTDPATIKNNVEAYDAASNTYLYQSYVNSGTFYPVQGNADWGQEGGNGNNASWFGSFFQNNALSTNPFPTNQNTTDTNGGYYYSFSQGTTSNGKRPLVQFFMLDGNQSDTSLVGTDGSGNTGDTTAAEVANSPQGQWLKAQLQSSNALYKLVVVHFPPYSALNNYNQQSSWMALPYQQWGATAVFSGHAHSFQYLQEPDTGPSGSGPTIPYIVDGLGGNGYDNTFTANYPGSKFEYANSYGALKLSATDQNLAVNFYGFDSNGNPTNLYTANIPPSAVPEPMSAGVATVGLAALALLERRRRRCKLNA